MTVARRHDDKVVLQLLAIRRVLQAITDRGHTGVSCNAHNHPPWCNCGWGGVNYGTGGGFDGPLVSVLGKGPPVTWRTFQPSYRYESFLDPNASCPECGAAVFFYQSPYGGRVFFDDAGPPWPKHPCTNRQFLAPVPFVPTSKKKRKRAQSVAASTLVPPPPPAPSAILHLASERSAGACASDDRTDVSTAKSAPAANTTPWMSDGWLPLLGLRIVPIGTGLWMLKGTIRPEGRAQELSGYITGALLPVTELVFTRKASEKEWLLAAAYFDPRTAGWYAASGRLSTKPIGRGQGFDLDIHPLGAS